MKKPIEHKHSPVLALATGAAALVAAFLFAPAALLRGSHPRYADHSNLIADVDASVDTYWRSGVRELSGQLAGLVDYWFQWHAIKIAISVLLVVTVGLLATSLWRRWLAWGSTGYAVTATLVTVFGALSVFAVIANVQSTVAPLVALLPMVSSDHPDPALAMTLTDIASAVDGSSSEQADSPVLQTMMDHVARYNWAMIAMATPLSAAFGAAGVDAIRRYRSAPAEDRRRRRVFVVTGAVEVVMTVALLFLLTAAVIAVADPSTALLDILGLSRLQ